MLFHFHSWSKAMNRPAPKATARIALGHDPAPRADSVDSAEWAPPLDLDVRAGVVLLLGRRLVEVGDRHPAAAGQVVGHGLAAEQRVVTGAQIGRPRGDLGGGRGVLLGVVLDRGRVGIGFVAGLVTGLVVELVDVGPRIDGHLQVVVDLGSGLICSAPLSVRCPRRAACA